jgi:hypothetical protein
MGGTKDGCQSPLFTGLITKPPSDCVNDGAILLSSLTFVLCRLSHCWCMLCLELWRSAGLHSVSVSLILSSLVKASQPAIWKKLSHFVAESGLSHSIMLIETVPKPSTLAKISKDPVCDQAQAAYDSLSASNHSKRAPCSFHFGHVALVISVFHLHVRRLRYFHLCRYRRDFLSVHPCTRLLCDR